MSRNTLHLIESLRYIEAIVGFTAFAAGYLFCNAITQALLNDLAFQHLSYCRTIAIFADLGSDPGQIQVKKLGLERPTRSSGAGRIPALSKPVRRIENPSTTLRACSRAQNHVASSIVWSIGADTSGWLNESIVQTTFSFVPAFYVRVALCSVKLYAELGRVPNRTAAKHV